ncbi:MAG: beta-ketoacyl-[acyl-carrier-protein] synthase family protein [Acidimicrobiia bacterium]|nr:beta-ketoacyl-[acyl-carrier-protein] synthase family protein [Acidimicrobiia bacterium]
MSPRRVAVTGIGVVAPCGIGAEVFWDGLLGPARVGAERPVLDFDPEPYFANRKESRRTDRFAQFALAAAAMALEEAGELTVDPSRAGVIIGTGVGGIQTLEDQIRLNYEKGPDRVSPFLVPMMMGNAAAAAVSMRYGWQGPCETTVTACAAGTHSIGNAARLIRDGRCDAVLAGGSETGLTPTATAGFRNMTALSTSGHSRPFDVRRDGFVMAEAAGVLVLEEWDTALARGATIIGEIMGSASTADAHHITAPAPGGAGAITCMELAIADAGLTTADIVHINAHGTSTPKNDLAEAEAVTKLFGGTGPLMTSTKGVTGHALGAAGAIEAAAVLLSMRHRLIPPTAGHEEPDPEMAPIDLVVGEPRPWEPGPSLSNSFGFGGHNGTLVIGPPPA